MIKSENVKKMSGDRAKQILFEILEKKEAGLIKRKKRLINILKRFAKHDKYGVYFKYGDIFDQEPKEVYCGDKQNPWLSKTKIKYFYKVSEYKRNIMYSFLKKYANKFINDYNRYELEKFTDCWMCTNCYIDEEKVKKEIGINMQELIKHEI